MRRGLWGLIVATLLAAGCVGSVDRAEFEQEVRERGGGISQTLAIDALAALKDEVGQDPVELLSFTVTNETATAVVRSPEFPDEFDTYVFRSGSLDSPQPFPSPPEVAELAVFSSDALFLNRLDGMVDEAIAEAGLRGGYAENVVIGAFGDTPVVGVQVTNDRRDVTVQFGPRGRLLGTDA